MISRARAHFDLMARTAGRRRVVSLVTLQLVVALMEGAGLMLLAPVLQSVSGTEKLTIPGLGLGLTLTGAVGLVLLVAAVRALAGWWVAIMAVDVRLAAADALQMELFDGLFHADWQYLAAQRRSDLLHRLTTEIRRVHDALALLVRMVVGGLVLIATVAVAVLLSPLIGGLAAATLIVVPLVARRSLRSASTLGSDLAARSEGLGAAVTDSLSFVRLIRAHDAAAEWSRLVAQAAERVRDNRRRYVRSVAAVVASLSIVAVVAVLALILLGSEAGLSLAQLAVLAVVASRVLAAAQMLVGAAQQFAHESAALDLLASFSREAHAHREPSQAVIRVHADTAADVPILSLRDVSWRYDPDLPLVLDSVSLDVPRRGLVTLSGDSGAGKSTLLDVVLGLLRPTSGEVLVDGAPLHDPPAWRARVGYVPQETVLAPGTIRQNLTWALPPGLPASDEDLWRALRMACIDHVVEALPGQLDTVLADLPELSGGEQQRLSIARALARQPDLMVFDEATSGLDEATEERLLTNVLDGSTALLVVSHRASVHGLATVTLRLDSRGLTIET